MAGRGAPTFLKRQKEQKRIARAQAKREAKQARRESRAAAAKPDDGLSDDVLDVQGSPELTERDPKPDGAPEN